MAWQRGPIDYFGRQTLFSNVGNSTQTHTKQYTKINTQFMELHIESFLKNEGLPNAIKVQDHFAGDDQVIPVADIKTISFCCWVGCVLATKSHCRDGTERRSFRVSTKPNGQSEVRISHMMCGENPLRHKENIQPPHRKVSVGIRLLLCCEAKR